VAPCESTIRRILQAVDPDALDAAVSAWLAARSVAWPPTRRMIAIDGKTARGARGPDGRAVHLLAAFDQISGVVLGQSAVDGKTNEINAFAPLLDRIDITDAIITADALHTQHRHADYLLGRGAHYLLMVKRNQPSLHRQLRALPWATIPAMDRTHDKGHGRIESRTVKLTTVTAGIRFPHAHLAIQITRRRRSLNSHQWHTETVYGITNLSWTDIQADHIADAARGHWGIENRLHWIRDVVFAEDHSQIRTGSGPAVMAILRNLAVSLHRLTGATNIAAACRHISRHPNRVIPLLI
jgi:predicted transposase YbfD/YdcC